MHVACFNSMCNVNMSILVVVFDRSHAELIYILCKIYLLTLYILLGSSYWFDTISLG